MTCARLLQPLAAALLLVSFVASPARGQDGVPPAYDSFYVFGDSLADNGNVWLTSKLLIAARQLTGPAPPPEQAYWQGRFSNGKVAFEYLWEALAPGGPALVPYISAPVLGRTGAVDFAFGGTGTPLLDQTPGGLWAPGLRGQVELFALGLRGRRPSSKALYAIVSGANDYRVGAYNVPMAPQSVVQNITDSVTRLYSLGAREILLLTLPDLGKLPYLTAEQMAQGSALTADHNRRLLEETDKLSTRYPQMKLRLVDVDAAFVLLRNDLEAAGIPVGVAALDLLHPAPITDPNGEAVLLPTGQPAPMSACLFVVPALCAHLVAEETPFPLLFWDVVHPTTYAHGFLARYMLGQLQQ